MTSDDSYSATLDMYEPTKALFGGNPIDTDKNRYEEEDDDATTSTSTGATLSTTMDQDHTPEAQSSVAAAFVDPPSRSSQTAAFETSMRDTLPSRNTYFLDGGNRFISVCNKKKKKTHPGITH